MTCPICQSQNEKYAQFCRNCGAKLYHQQQNVCPTCQTPNESHARFCKKCRTKLYYQQQKTLEKKLQKQARYNRIGSLLFSSLYKSIMTLLIFAFIACGIYALIAIIGNN
jgi:predicted amidophosphoribosyltransferase